MGGGVYHRWRGDHNGRQALSWTQETHSMHQWAQKGSTFLEWRRNNRESFWFDHSLHLADSMDKNGTVIERGPHGSGSHAVSLEGLENRNRDIPVKVQWLQWPRPILIMQANLRGFNFHGLAIVLASIDAPNLFCFYRKINCTVVFVSLNSIKFVRQWKWK